MKFDLIFVVTAVASGAIQAFEISGISRAVKRMAFFPKNLPGGPGKYSGGPVNPPSRFKTFIGSSRSGSANSVSSFVPPKSKGKRALSAGSAIPSVLPKPKGKGKRALKALFSNY